MPARKSKTNTAKKSFATLAKDLNKIRKRQPSAKQIEELNSVLIEPERKPSEVSPRKKIARPPETEA